MSENDLNCACVQVFGFRVCFVWYVCMYVYMYVCIPKAINSDAPCLYGLYVCTVCMYARMYVCMYAGRH